MSTKVLLVCTGNTCRSPMAAAILKGLRPDWQIRSAGVGARAGQEASAHARTVIRQRGLDLSEHRSRLVDAELVNWADHILCLTESHRRALVAHFPQAAGKTRTLADRDLQDPFGQALEVYADSAGQIEAALKDWLNESQ